jgi:hypothetical protein
MNDEFNSKQVLNGIISELISATLTYPLNTLKINTQVGRNVIIGKNLISGIKWCLLTEAISAVFFYSIFSGITKLLSINPLIRSSVGSTIAILNSYPYNVRRKLEQVGKKITVTNKYKGLPIALINGVPGVAINFTIREHLKEKLPNDLKPLSGVISTMISIIATHPLDTLSTCVATRSPIRLVDCLKYSGFKERFIEKNITIGSKMIILELLSNSK